VVVNPERRIRLSTRREIGMTSRSLGCVALRPKGSVNRPCANMGRIPEGVKTPARKSRTRACDAPESYDMVWVLPFFFIAATYAAISFYTPTKVPTSSNTLGHKSERGRRNESPAPGSPTVAMTWVGFVQDAVGRRPCHRCPEPPPCFETEVSHYGPCSLGAGSFDQITAL